MVFQWQINNYLLTNRVFEGIINVTSFLYLGDKMYNISTNKINVLIDEQRGVISSVVIGGKMPAEQGMYRGNVLCYWRLKRSDFLCKRTVPFGIRISMSFDIGGKLQTRQKIGK